jgi:hypothetical protein
MKSPTRRATLLIATASLFLLSLSSCNMISGVGAVVGRAVPHYTAARYKGLSGQTVVVMVWVERGIRMDYPDLQLDVANGVQNKLMEAQATAKPDELKGTTFPIHPETVVRTQEDHPEFEQQPILQTASRFNVQRLIYIEVTDFSTRSTASTQLFRGSMTGNLKVIEISPDGKTKQGYNEEDIRIEFPKTGPKDGAPNGGDYKYYQGTLNEFTTEIATRLFTFENDED